MLLTIRKIIVLGRDPIDPGLPARPFHCYPPTHLTLNLSGTIVVPLCLVALLPLGKVQCLALFPLGDDAASGPRSALPQGEEKEAKETEERSRKMTGNRDCRKVAVCGRRRRVLP